MGQFFVFFLVLLFFRALLVSCGFRWMGHFFVFFLADYLLVAAPVVVTAFLVVVLVVLVVVLSVLVGAWVVREGGGLLTWRVRCEQLCRV